MKSGQTFKNELKLLDDSICEASLSTRFKSLSLSVKPTLDLHNKDKDYQLYFPLLSTKILLYATGSRILPFIKL